MQTQAASPLPSSPPSEGFLLPLWSRLTAPSPKLVGDARRRASILTAFLVILFPLAVIAVFATPITSTIAGEEASINPGLIVVLVFVLVAYFVSRTEYFVYAAYFVISLPFLGATFAAAANPDPIASTSYYFTTLGVLFASLLLGWKETLISGVLTGIGMVILNSVKPGDFNVANVTFIAVTTGVTALVSRIRDIYIHTLEDTQAQLRQQFIETDLARQKAETSDKVKSSFLASMSHELRTPLNAIINFTKFVAKGDLGEVNQDQQETLYEVVDSAKHLLNLINDVLDMSKIESGSLNLFVADDIDVSAIVTQVVSTGRALITDKEVEIKTELDGELPLIRGDRQRLTQIFLNIMSNACKFTKEGSIKVHSYRKAENIIIEISDTGPGIALEDQAAVFEAFKQTESGLRQGGGTGLGMPITKSLVEAHGGTLQLVSQAGKGATFIVSLPIKSSLLKPTLAAGQ